MIRKKKSRPAKGWDDESGASHDRDDRRGNGDRGARRSRCRAPVRLSRRRGAADLRRLVSAGQGAAHPGAARAGRRARRRRLCALDRQGRRRPRHLGTGRHQRRHRPHRRAVRLDPDRRPHRAGADASDRQRRLPGMRHRRHHPAVHQIQLSGQERRGSAARAARGVPHRRERAARPGRGRYPQGRAVRQGRLTSSPRNSSTAAISPRSRATSTRSSRPST